MLRVLLTLWVAVFAFACGSAADAQQKQQFMPDNDLYKEDTQFYALNGMTEQLFNRIIDIGYNLYSPVAQQWGERLTITRLWQDSTVNASAWRDGYGNTEIRLYGGMGRREEVLPLSFALVMCHEFSHLFGGSPYIEPRLYVAAEGQSDYMGAGWCLRNVTEQLFDNTPFNTTPYMNQVCGSDRVCLKRFAAANGLGQLLARLGNQPAPRFETPDRTVVNRTEVSYPRTTQCRLDTYKVAILNQARPRYWYAGG